MTSTNFPLGPPDSSGLLYVVNNASCIAALTTHFASSVEPAEKPQIMHWFDLRTNVMNVRTPDGTAWMPLFRVRGNKIYPLQAGAELSPIVTLETGKQGYVYATGTAFEVKEIDSPEIPLFGVNSAGIVPGVTNQQSGLPAALRSDGSWQLGPAQVASRAFTGAKEYAMTVPAASRYFISMRAKLSSDQVLMMQIGSGGSPKQIEYKSRAARGYVNVAQGANSLSSSQVTNSSPTGSDRGFVLWQQYSAAQDMVVQGTLTKITGNQWLWSGTGNATGGQATNGDASNGYVTLPGDLNYIRVLSGGDNIGTFNNQNSIDDGGVVIHV